MKLLLPCILSVLILTVSCRKAEQAGGKIIDQAAKARIDAVLKSFVDTNRVAGISALIFENNKEVYFNAFGMADREAGIPMDRNSIVRIFSMTKPVTGVALMQLHEKGLFQLDDPLGKYIPAFEQVQVFSGFDDKGNMKLEAPHRPITVRDITRHTAGFLNAGNKDLGKLYTDADLMNKNNTLEQMVAKLAKLPLAFHPGEQWSYGICVDVQAYLVEKLSGERFDQYVLAHVLNPLKMNDTRYVPSDMKRLAAMYNRSEGKLNRVADSVSNAFNGQEWPLKPGGFGLTSTLDDYMRFARMLVNGGKLDDAVVLKDETVKLMATNQLSDSVTERMWLPSKGQVGFGIDFAVRLREAQGPDEKVGAVGEFFWDGAASTLFWVDPANRITAVLFMQIFPFDNPVHKEFKDAVYGKYNAVNP